MGDKLQDNIANLRINPIHSMSLGSKELFHSNFWAWIMDNADVKEEFINFFFKDISDRCIHPVGREKKHMDITINKKLRHSV